MWPKEPKWTNVMSIESEWAERFRRRASEYDDQATGRRLIYRDNFDLFIAKEEVAGWQQFQDAIAGRFEKSLGVSWSRHLELAFRDVARTCVLTHR
jgi:hypothetical protein